MLAAGSDFKTKQASRKYYLEQEKQQTALNKNAEIFIILQFKKHPKMPSKQ